MSPKGREQLRLSADSGEEAEAADRAPTPPENAPPEVARVFARGAEAWRPFLRAYSPFILGCLRRLADDYDERMEIYVHVCRRLRADDCRRIKQFRGRGSGRACKFTTWLAAVTFNLAREWIRTSRGRRRLFRSVSELPERDRLVFRYFFWERYGVGEIAELLTARHHLPTTRGQVADSLESIEGCLTRDHRWRLLTRTLRSIPPISIDGPRGLVADGIPFEVPDGKAGPESRSRRAWAVSVLRRLMDELPKEEALALRMKFGRGMTAKAVARALDIANYKRVYEIQARAMRRLARGMEAEGVQLTDFRDGAGALDVLE